MKDVQINKRELLAIIKENKDKHIEAYELAVEKYHELLEEKFDELTQSLHAWRQDLDDTNGPFKFKVNLPVPESHEEDYDKAIQMLELDERESITLTDYEFNQFVRDEWDWARSFRANTMSYTAG